MLAYSGQDMVELSELQLFAGASRVDDSATLSADRPPVEGSLAALSDGSTSSTVLLEVNTVLTWDFSSQPADVTNVRLGSADQVELFTRGFVLESSDDGVLWKQLYVDAFSGIAWPGPKSLTVSQTRPVSLGQGFYKDWIAGNLTGQTLYSAGSASQALDAGGRLVITASPGADAKVRFAPALVASDVDASVTALIGAADIGVVFRTTSWVTTNDTYAYVVAVNATAIWLDKGSNSSSGSWLRIASVALDGMNLSGIVVLRVNMVGSRIRCFLNGVLLIDATDSSHSAAGECGLRVYNASGGATVFSFSVNQVASRLLVAQQLLAGTSRSTAVAIGHSTAVDNQEITLNSILCARDIEFGGRGRIFGTVARKNTPSNIPISRRVRLHRSRDGLLVRETWSRADGSYEFRGISTRYEYDVTAWDHELLYRSVVSNNLKPEV
ncbi:hypothetical protein [Comamonas sp.]|uniref:hypothetical protein n=1 Tax=Comamonas sp. TaxID=34028 RepID=UPI0028AECB7D|nr:hypothetical protein [Comamonas sp.]